MSLCPICASGDYERIAVDYTFIRHLDFSPMRHQAATLDKCTRCQTIYMADPAVLEEVRCIYHGEEYAREKKTEHVAFTAPAAGGFTTTYALMADLVAARAAPGGPTAMLDVGCFDGKLLVEIGKRFPDARLHGFDVTAFVGDIFPKGPRFAYTHGDLARVEGRYDVIAIVNTLMYVDDLPALMRHLDRLLAPGGQVFVVVMNPMKNPFFLTCGDQYFYPTPANLRNMFRHFGFRADLETAHPAFPRSIVAFCTKAPGAGNGYEPDDTLRIATRYLSSAGRRLKALAAERRGGRFCVLGCTNNAAWAYNQIGDAIDCFADENPYRVGRRFYDRPVVHPRDLHRDDVLVVPYGDTAAPIVEKFSGLYAARLEAI